MAAPAPMPDLSHLTEEERKIILSVMERQQEEEQKNAAVIRQLKDDLDNYQKSVKQLDDETKTRSSGSHANGAVCQICHKTKFADGVGHSCNYCQLKSCARCGGKVTLRSNKSDKQGGLPQVLWVCNICRKKQEILTRSGQWFHTDKPKQGKHDMESPSGSETASLVSTKDSEQKTNEGSRGSDKENIPKGAPTQGPRGRELKRQYSMSKDETRRERTPDSRDPRDIRGDPRHEHWRGSHGDVRTHREYDERTRGHPRSSSRHPDDVHYYSDHSERQYPVSARDREHSRDRYRYPDDRGRHSERDRFPPERGRSYTPDRDRHRYERDRFSDPERGYADAYADHRERGYADPSRRYDRHSAESDKRRHNDGLPPERPPSAHSDLQSPNSRYLAERRLSNDSVASRTDSEYSRGGRERSARMQHEREQREREQRQREKELEMERQIERERQRELEHQRQLEREHERQRQNELEQQRLLEVERQQEIERQRELERKENERQRELELQRQRELERQRDLERQRELEIQRNLEIERQRQLEHQRQVDIEHKRQLELERKREAERERQRANDIPRPSSADRERHNRPHDLDYSKHSEHSQMGRAGRDFDPTQGQSPRPAPRHSITIEEVDNKKRSPTRQRELESRTLEISPYRQHLDPSSAAMRKSRRDTSRKADVMMIRNDSLSSDQSECVRPPPPKPHKHKKGSRKARQFSLSSSEEEIRSTPECTSCEDVEIESESVSEKGELESYDGKRKAAMQSGHHSESEMTAAKKKIVRFGRGEGRSMDEDLEWSEPQIKDSGVDTSSSTTLYEEHNLSKHPVTWQPDLDNNRLIGHMILKKVSRDGTPPRDSSAILGLKVVGGKMTDHGKLSAFITKVKKGSIADTVGHLRAGDEVLNWNGRNLQGATFDEVYDIVLDSKSEPLVELVVARAMGDIGPGIPEKQNRDIISKRASLSKSSSSGYDSGKMKEDEEPSKPRRPSVTITSPGSPTPPGNRPTSLHSMGQIQIKMWYDNTLQQLVVTILSAEHLSHKELGERRNPYVKLYILPDRSDKTKRRTKTIAKSNNPKWNQTFMWDLKRAEFRGSTLEVTMWDFDRFGSNEFLGEVLVDLDRAPLDDEPHWYILSNNHDKNMPIPGGSPKVSRRSKKSHRDGEMKNTPRGQISGNHISDSEQSDLDYDDGIGVVTGSTVVGVGDGASVSSYGSSCSPPPRNEGNSEHIRQQRNAREQERRQHTAPQQPVSPSPRRRTGTVLAPPREELNDRPQPHTLTVPDQPPRPRTRSPSPGRRGRPPSGEYDLQRSRSPTRRSDIERSRSPTRRSDIERARSPTRRSDIPRADLHRRSQSEIRGNRDLEREYHNAMVGTMSPPDMRSPVTSLPSSPIRHQATSPSRSSPSSTPSTPRKHRQLPQLPVHQTRGDRAQAELEERARQMKLKMKMNQYKQAASANTLSPHLGMAVSELPQKPRMRKQSPDNISIKSSDSNVSSTSDVSGITQVSETSRISTMSTQSQAVPGQKATRKLSAFSAKMQSNAPNKKPLNRSSSSSDVYSYEKQDGSISDSAAEPNTREGKKRRASIGYKMAALVGLSKKSSSTSQLSATEGSGKKPRSSIVRSEEVGVPFEMRNRMVKQTSRESTDGSICSLSSESSSSLAVSEATTDSYLSHFTRMWLPTGLRLGPEGHFGDFIDGLGPAQLVGRQVLGSPCLGDIQVGICEKNGHLEVEVVRARGLMAKPGTKLLPAPYVKVYLMDGKRCVGKRKTKIARRTLDPLYQQTLTFEEEHKGKVLQITVWGDYGRMDRKVFMGVSQILLDDIDLSSNTLGWYKLFTTSSLADTPHRSSVTSMESSNSYSSIPTANRVT
ncbi:regulating synaptic membrane exocytosis protein 2-like isoform X5 [Ptychodera flava]|uniref:regulating synaptic membrane exocytosis protein 2-like isoform X5 n=1 Tax=Ptychodera flava TaxID=63121 RepID=UPI003969F9C2